MSKMSSESASMSSPRPRSASVSSRSHSVVSSLNTAEFVVAERGAAPRRPPTAATPGRGRWGK